MNLNFYCKLLEQYFTELFYDQLFGSQNMVNSQVCQSKNFPKLDYKNEDFQKIITWTGYLKLEIQLQLRTCWAFWSDVFIQVENSSAARRTTFKLLYNMLKATIPKLASDVENRLFRSISKKDFHFSIYNIITIFCFDFFFKFANIVVSQPILSTVCCIISLNA